MLLRTTLAATFFAATLLAAYPTAEELADGAAALNGHFCDAPFSISPKWQDRAAWATAAKNGKTNTAAIIRQAEKLLETPFPAWPEEAYYDFSTNGNRNRYQDLNRDRYTRADAIVAAELLEGKGRFIPAIVEMLNAFCDEDKTWVLPAHDGNQVNVKQKAITIDLVSSAVGWRLATLVDQFGDTLPAATREKVIKTVRERVVAPSLTMLDTPRFNHWVRNNANWNAVCHAGVVGATLALPGTTASEKARVVASARAHVKIFLSGFDADGWCSEGVGYWGYGFGNFVYLAETVRGATGGKEDWLQWPEARLPARSAPACMILDEVYPSFADCSADVKPDPDLVAWLNARLGWNLPGAPLAYPKNPALFPAGALFTPDRLPADAAPSDPILFAGARSWFPDAEVLIERGKGTRFGAAIKGGHNGVPHNHNDAGTFMAVYRGVPVLTDAGGETYTSRTFSSRRYESDLLNSYGHAVPYPAKTLQKPGTKHAAKILKTDFRDDADTLLLDLAPAYASDRIEALTRTFTWSHTLPRLIIEDRFAFNGEADTFETALITFGTCRQTAPDTLQVTHRDQTLTVKVEASAPWSLSQSTLTAKQDSGAATHRLALTLDAPAQSGFIRMTITP